jgi:hypothetical protein
MFKIGVHIDMDIYNMANHLTLLTRKGPSREIGTP